LWSESVFHGKVASRNLPFKTDHHQDLDFWLSDVVTIGLNTPLGPPHPLEKNPDQGRLSGGSQNALDRREQSLPNLE
jgi:hypothetical protein